MITLRVLGPLAVSVDGRDAPPELTWRKNVALLVYLARSPRRTRSREHLVGLLWGDKAESSARHSLREAIRVLRQALGEAALTTQGDQIRLADNAVLLDIERFEQAARVADWPAAAALLQGAFLEGFSVPDAPAFEDWLAVERLAFARRAVDALVRHADTLQRAGTAEGSGEAAQRALDLDPLSEAAARALLLARALRGDRGGALAVYESFAAKLREVAGAEPAETTRQLAEQVRRERAWRSSGQHASGAQSRRAPLAGRTRELAALLEHCAAARRARATVVVLQGDPGMGRTRLVEELALRARLDGATVVLARGTPADRAEPWSGVFALAAGGLLEAPGIAATASEALAPFAARLDEWGDRFPGARRAAAPGPGPAFGAIVRTAATEQLLVLIVDDAHCLDAETLTALRALARDAARASLLLLLTVTTAPAREEIDQLVAVLGRDVPGGIIALEPLSGDALRALARWAMPAWSDEDINRLARRVAVDSAGLPLLAVELLHAVALGLDLEGTPAAWPQPQRTLDQTLPGDIPATVVAAIRIGYRRLSRDAQTALAAAAVLGDRTEPSRLADATGLAPDALAAALDEAEWQRWIIADGRGYSFVARIARDVVARDMLTEGQRRRILDRHLTPS